MALRLSRRMCQLMAGGKAEVNNSYGPGDEIVSFTDGGGTGSTDEIVAASGTPFSGFFVGDMVTVMTESGTNDGTYEIVGITGSGDTLEVPAGSFTAESAVTAGLACIATARGHSVSDLYRRGILRFYTGSQVATPETAISGTLVLAITVGAGAWVAGADDYGLNFDVASVLDTSGQAAGGKVAKDLDQTWNDAALAAGTVGWWRMYDNANGDTLVADSSSQYVRMDGDVGVGSGDISLSNNVLALADPVTIDSFNFTVPGNYTNP